MEKLLDYHDKVWQAILAHDVDAVENYVAPNCRFLVPGVLDEGFERVRPILQTYLQGFPDTGIEVKSSLEDGETLVVRSTLTGKHTGVMPTLQGGIQPTGLDVAFETMEWMTIQNGKISEWRFYLDSTPFINAMNNIQAQVLNLGNTLKTRKTRKQSIAPVKCIFPVSSGIEFS